MLSSSRDVKADRDDISAKTVPIWLHHTISGIHYSYEGNPSYQKESRDSLTRHIIDRYDSEDMCLSEQIYSFNKSDFVHIEGGQFFA